MGRTEEVPFSPTRIGYIPETDFGISLDEDLAVTHNTAILGILGSGKTRFGWEMIQRILLQGIKVVALDITGRYAPHFREICPPSTQRVFEEHIESQIEALVDETTVRGNEAGNIAEFKQALAECLSFFYENDSRLLILNPNRFRVTRMEGRPYQGHANYLGELSMVDITSLIADELLRIMQRDDIARQRREDENDLDETEATVESERASLCLVLEEAHSLVPEWNSVAQEGERTAVAIAARAILQGRKYGYGCLLITQRTANVTKSILNQCNTIVALRNYDATGVGFLENYVGPVYSKTLASLRDREAVVFGRASSCNAPVIIRVNDTSRFRDDYWNGRVEDVPMTTPPPEQFEVVPSAGTPADEEG